MTDFYGFERLDFEFEGMPAILVKPEKPNGKWLFKTEYFGAFPDFEVECLKLGYHVANIKNSTRWHKDEDTERAKRFCEYLSESFGLAEKCMTVGMSCGGMHAIYLAAKYPEKVAAMYLDAPVVDLLSCPGNSPYYEESVNATGMTREMLKTYKNHPKDHIGELVENKVPIFLIAGDSDTIVPFCENGKFIADAYEKTDIPFVKVIKKGCNHHPHGLDDNTPIVEFMKKYYGE